MISVISRVNAEDPIFDKVPQSEKQKLIEKQQNIGKRAREVRNNTRTDDNPNGKISKEEANRMLNELRRELAEFERQWVQDSLKYLFN